MARKIITRICSIDGCEKFVKYREMCSMHYARWYKEHKRNGTQPWLRLPGEPWSIDHPNFAQYFWSRIALTADDDRCWEWQHSRNPQGYGCIKIDGQTRRVHRIAWQLANGREPKLDVLHSCDNPPCCNPKHLREGTAAENGQEAREKGRWTPNYGEQNGNTYLTADEVREIKMWIRDGISTKEMMARDPRLDKYMVSRLRCNKTWQHVTL